MAEPHRGLRLPMARVAAAALAFAILASCDALRSFEAVCEARLPPVAVTVEAEPLSYRIDRRHSFAELTRKGAAIAGEGRFVLGLTEASLQREVQLRAPGVASRARSKYCMRPQIAVNVTFNPVTVYLGRDDAEGSCRDRLTFDHELRHIAVYQTFLGGFADRVRGQLIDHFGNRILYFGSAEEAQAHVDRVLAEFLSPLVQQAMEEVRSLQRAVDSPDEYARLDDLRRRCD